MSIEHILPGTAEVAIPSHPEWTQAERDDYAKRLKAALAEPGAWDFLNNIDLKAETDGVYDNDGKDTGKGLGAYRYL